MIEQLAEEFYLLSAMVDQDLIPLSEEIRLCQAHLRLMSLRKHCHFSLCSDVADTDCQVPPGIVHTLIENAFSHNTYQKGEFIFHLLQYSSGNQVSLQVQCPRSLAESDEAVSIESSHKSKGLGSQYILQRLEQSFRQAWRIDESQTKTLWQTNIHWTRP